MLMLEQGYSVPLADIEWNTGDPKKLQDNRMGLSLKPGPSSDDKNFQRLLNGDLDAVIVTTGPRYWSMFGPNKRDKTIARYPGLRPLINDPEMMAETYRRTGLCPITDTAVVTAELVNRHPALPAQLVGAFSQANDLAPKYRSEKENDLAQREIQLLGEDPHRYGLGKNQRRNLATLLDLFARLGVLERYIEPEDLFVPSTRSLG